MSELHCQSLVDLSNLLASGTCSSVELVDDVLGAIDRADGEIGAYLSLDREGALAQAREADTARAKGGGDPLLGIPIAIKDLLNVKGQPCGCASKLLNGFVSPYDATSMARLRERGAVFLGRVNMDEFAMGGSTENSGIQVTRNPWDVSRVPGGSSGGSAAAVGGHLAVASVGSDTGGSVRQPAAFCGCVGLKPTYGRISRFGLTAFASSLDQVGPLTKRVEDAAILLQAMAGHDPLDSTSVDVPVPDYRAGFTKSLEGVTLGLPAEYFIDGMNVEVERAVRDAVEHCTSLGATIVDVSLPHTSYAIATYYVIATAEASANLARFDGVRYGARVEGGNPIEMVSNTRASGFGEEVKRRVLLGTYVLSSGYYDAYYVRAQKVRTLIRRDFEAAFSTCDALLTPTAPHPAFPIGDMVDDPLQMYLCDIFTVTANLAGICGLSVPCGFSSDGLPIGMQLLGPAFAEERILNIGHAYEQTTEWHQRMPGPESLIGEDE